VAPSLRELCLFTFDDDTADGYRSRLTRPLFVFFVVRKTRFVRVYLERPISELFKTLVGVNTTDVFIYSKLQYDRKKKT